MRIKTLASAIAAGLYATGAMHAIAQAGPAPAAPTKAIELQAMDFTPEQLDRFRKRAAAGSQQSVLQNDGLNVQVRRQTEKFIEERGITGEHVYLVRLHDEPVATYRGGKAGFAPTHATLMKQGRKTTLNKPFKAGQPQAPAVEKYRSHLLEKQAVVLNKVQQRVGSKAVRRQFTNAVNGFSMKMTQDEARRIAQMPDVAFVERSKIYELHSDEGPKLIGADQLWTGSANATAGVPHKGEGIIVGIIDTGVNTDHRSFADVADDGYDHNNPWGQGVYVGDCTVSGQESMCNDKLIGVRSYPVITDYYDLFNAELGTSIAKNGEDYDGHGSHTASTTAGNVLLNVDYVVPAASKESDGTLVAENLVPQMSGVAPRANIVSYQACFPNNDFDVGGCPGESIVASIEDAIADGVDVINFSIGGQDSFPWESAMELAFLAAREAGISVSASAGNAGQLCGEECFSAIDHASPWLLNVAASTHGRSFNVDTPISHAGAIDTGNVTKTPSWETSGLVGGSINGTEITGVVVQAKDYPNINGGYDQYCGEPYAAGTFDNYPSQQNGGAAILDSMGQRPNVIVVCARNRLDDPNGIARSVKADNVKAGGADGFVLYNASNGDPLSIASYSLPSAHITSETWWGQWPEDGLSTWLNNWGDYGHMITIGSTQVARTVNQEDADWLAPFSSRGPSWTTPESLIPMVAAPGVDIYAAYADQHPFSSQAGSGDFAAISGTSMAAPHAAGALALIREAHPDWTATEVQSALMLTAEKVVKYKRLNRENGQEAIADTYRAGAGRINVARAVQAGLVMDETAENFRLANPNNGGLVHRLNIPQLVDMSCAPNCQWMRTFKATEDGTWKVSAGDVVNWNPELLYQSEQNGVTITATPSEFSLKKGETQTVVINASIMTTSDAFGGSETELHSDLTLTPANGGPELRLPMAFKYDNRGMPETLTATAHRNDGDFQFNGINLVEAASPVGRVFAPVKAEVKQVSLPKDDETAFPWDSYRDESVAIEMRLDEATHIEWINVPANAKRVVVESHGTVDSNVPDAFDIGNAVLYLGKDYNNDGKVDPLDEILCASLHLAANNFCNVEDPEPGNYWVIIYNPPILLDNAPIHPDALETFSYSTAVITDTEASNLSVEVPASTGQEPVSVTLNWDMPDMQTGDIYYSMMDFGSSAVNPGNLGMVSLKLVRGKDDVTLEVPQDSARPGDEIPFTFSVLPNNSGRDRNFTLTAEMPEGLNFSADDIYASNSEIVSDVTVDGRTIVISGMQPDTGSVQPDYVLTSNNENAANYSQACMMPDFGQSDRSGYMDLLGEFGMTPDFGGMRPLVTDDNGYPVYDPETGYTYDGGIDFMSGVSIPVSSLFRGWRDNFHLYNNGEQMNFGKQNELSIKANGLIAIDALPVFWPFNNPLPDYSIPNEKLAPLWRGSMGFFGPQQVLSTEYNPSPWWPEENSGVTLAAAGEAGWGIIEFDNAKDYHSEQDWFTGIVNNTPLDNSFDFQVVFNTDVRHGDGEHELYFAYDNINFGSLNDHGTIGLQGYRGAMTPFGPLEGYLGESYVAKTAFDVEPTTGLRDTIHDNLLLCWDYRGPESSQFDVTVPTRVASNAAGMELVVEAVSQVDELGDKNLSHTIVVPSNLTISAIADKQVDEDGSFDITVFYADETAGRNEITISGDNVSGIADGWESGSTVTITPAADFHGETEVTVTVADLENPADAASTSFMLTVNGVNDAPMAAVAGDVTITEGESATLDASGSSDPDGDMLSFSWAGNGTIADATQATTTVSNLGAGEHVFTVIVSDGALSAEASLTVTVESAVEDEVEVTEKPKKKRGGSVYYLLGLLALAGLVRRRRFA
ncbi:S8 family serine peptidase [Microbulbifer salipaludis]|uniref:S8 family serine peptidase n=1 Tax=Microbulbifer salipaludis TaxID=187980 RepID=A0ABS3E2M9_9GAMM|nr:S8 family serine peptidase [Microbulbifer salipaludis]MBN8429535.1 S8 family serine peptidase [Microbulbifer salipaludis]